MTLVRSEAGMTTLRSLLGSHTGQTQRRVFVNQKLPRRRESYRIFRWSVLAEIAGNDINVDPIVDTAWRASR